jgi:hypothetical protein
MNNHHHFYQALYLKLDGLVSPLLCRRFIVDYQKTQEKSFDQTIKLCSEQVFNQKLDTLLFSYFSSDYDICWPTFEVVDFSAWQHNYSTRWHLDGGVKKTLKLFVYLNAVEEHGGNTLLLDKFRTEKIRSQGLLPLEYNKRKVDLTAELQQLNLKTTAIAYSLAAGDALLFNPLALAHKCLPPSELEKRYTISYTIVPKV